DLRGRAGGRPSLALGLGGAAPQVAPDDARTLRLERHRPPRPAALGPQGAGDAGERARPSAEGPAQPPARRLGRAVARGGDAAAPPASAHGLDAAAGPGPGDLRPVP